MQKIWSSSFIEGFERAFQDIKADYQRAPFMYMSKWDVVGDVLARIRHVSKLQDVDTGRFTIGKDGRWRQKDVDTGKVKTYAVHSGIGFEMGEKARCDICFIDMTTMQFALTARYSKRKPTSIASWRFDSGAGISVVYNADVQYSKRKNKTTGRFAKTEGLKLLEKEVLKEIADLKAWDKSILLFVDNHGLYTKGELEEAFSKRLDPYTMRMYYLSPRSGFFITGKRQDRD